MSCYLITNRVVFEFVIRVDEYRGIHVLDQPIWAFSME